MSLMASTVCVRCSVSYLRHWMYQWNTELDVLYGIKNKLKCSQFKTSQSEHFQFAAFLCVFPSFPHLPTRRGCLDGKRGGIRWFRRGLVICIQLFHQSHIFLRTKLTAFPPRRPSSEGTFKQSFYSDLYFCLIISSSYRNPSASAVERVFFPFLKCCRIKTTAMRRENNKYLFSHSHLRG